MPYDALLYVQDYRSIYEYKDLKNERKQPDNTPVG